MATCIAVTCLRGLYGHFVALAKDNVDAARLETREGLRSWAQSGFHMPQLWELWSSTEIDIYEGNGPAAWARVERGWTPLNRSLLLYVHYNAVVMTDLRGRAALGAALQAEGRSREQLLQTAERCAKRLVRGNTRWATALGTLLSGGVSLARNQGDRAAESFRTSHKLLTELDMRLLAAVASRRCGEFWTGTRTRASAAPGRASSGCGSAESSTPQR